MVYCQYVDIQNAPIPYFPIFVYSLLLEISYPKIAEVFLPLKLFKNSPHEKGFSYIIFHLLQHSNPCQQKEKDTSYWIIQDSRTIHWDVGFSFAF